MAACGIKEQAEELQALQKCTYEIVSADSVYIAGTNISQLISNQGLNLLQAPRVAFAYMQQKMPVSGILQLKIINPGTEEAGINQFEYKVYIKDRELLSGFIDKKTTVSPNGGSAIIPIKIDKDLYPLLSDSTVQNAITQFLTSKKEETVVVTFKIKPKFIVANEVIEYPDYISIDKNITNTRLMSYLKGMH
jgi:LEA14-like dessication related protein